MRKGWRWAGAAGLLVLLGGLAIAAGPRAGRGDETAIKLTLDVTWGDPALPALPPGAAAEDPTAIDLEVGEGRVIEAISAGENPWVPKARADGSYRIGTGPAGKTRVRIETTASSPLVAKVKGASTRFAVAGLFDAPLRTGPGSPVPIEIERVPWDALEVHLGPDGQSDGVFAPGSTIPLSLGFNILLPEPGDVAVRYWGELRPARGGEPVWTLPAGREIVASNATRPPGVILSMPAPQGEGSYVLEVHATWEPLAAAEGSRLARLFKRRRKEFPVNLARRTSFAVIGARGTTWSRPPVFSGEAVVDGLDLTRSRAQRIVASGRGPAPGGPTAPWTVPEAALVEMSRRDRLRGWNPFAGTDGAVLAPASAQGLAWSAVALHANDLGRPHRLTVKLAEGPASDLAVALIAPGAKPRMILDAAASGPTVPEGASAASFSWPIWPDAEDLVLVLANRSTTAPLKLAAVELRALNTDPEPPRLSETHATAPRSLALHLATRGALERFGGDGAPDAWGMAEHVAAYASACGASSVVLAEGAGDRLRRAALEGQAHEDATGPDRLDLIFRALDRARLSALLEVRFDANLPGLPPADSAEALAKGLVRVDRAGKADGPAYQPLRAEVRDAMIAKAVAAIAPRSKHPNLAGLVVRLGPGATLPGSPDVGLDDATYPAFVRGAFQADALNKVPALDGSDARRFAARWNFVNGAGREDWLNWRAARVGALYGDMDAAVKKAARGAVLVVATPGVDDGPAGAEARRADRSGVAPLHAWKAVGLDLAMWPDGPAVVRGVGLSTDDLGHDLATSDDLDAAVAARPGRGLWLGVTDSVGDAAGVAPRMSARPISDGPLGDEPLGHALAVLDARWVIVSGAAAAGQEERLARFAAVYRALPNLADTQPPAPRPDSGVAVRSWEAGGRTFVAIANDTPYTVLMESIIHAPADAPIDDLGRWQRLSPAAAPGGGKSVVLQLPPFGSAALRVGAVKVRVEPVPLYRPSIRDLDAQREQLSARLERMTQGGPSSGPRNAGFEESAGPATAPKPLGWSVEGDAAIDLEIGPKGPHSGRASLRLDARAAGASAASDPFAPPGRTAMEIRAALRADRAATPVRVWIEGESEGKPFRRHADGVTGGEWAEFRMSVADLPPGGLDRVRLRFERTTAGPLWVDDVTVTGDGPSDSTRRAQLILTAALHAYREKRFADFARLAGSHWAKHAEFEDPDHSSAVRAAGSPTDLPSGRRLR